MGPPGNRNSSTGIAIPDGQGMWSTAWDSVPPLGFAALGSSTSARRSFLVQSPLSFEGAEVQNSEGISGRRDHGEQRFCRVKCDACRRISPGQVLVFFVKRSNHPPAFEVPEFQSVSISGSQKCSIA